MIEDENLKYFITEDIFLVNDPAVEDEKVSKPAVIAKEETSASEVEILVEKDAEVITPKTESLVTQETEKSSLQPQEMIHELVVLVLPMNSQDKELLNNLLIAINKSFSDIKLIDSFSDFKENFKILLSFGYQAELQHSLNKSLLEYTPHKIGENQILISKPLSALHGSKDQKTKLWKCLKELFL
jgi:hypothetical protein